MSSPATPSAASPPPEDLKRDLSGPDVELVETHISWVFLQGDDVWKIKKPVSLGFLDFSTSEKRYEACKAEVHLNRRLAPHVYQGCVPITRDSDGHYAIDGAGEPVDWAVHMVRLSDELRADHLLAAGQLGGRRVERLAERLAMFHTEARCDDETASYGEIDAITVNVRENFTQTRETIGDYLNPEQAREIEVWQTGFLEESGDLFAARLASDRVRDGHGDLRLEHVYFDDAGRVTVIDCIEFNQRFRFADVCADIAFLAMDLTWHGRPDLSERFLAAYARAANDFDLYPLVDFYESYRAFVRGKVASMLAMDAGAGHEIRIRAAREARRYFLLALASERRSLLPPMMVAVGGWIASGKSTVADGLAAELAAPVVDSDRTRKSMLGVASTRNVHVKPWQGAYSPQFSDKVYAEMLRRAGAVLSSGRTVIVDASFRSPENRAAVRRLAREHGVPFYFVECQADREVCRQRLRRRDQEERVTDGRLEIFDDFLELWEPVDELASGEHLVWDTTHSRPGGLTDLLARMPEADGREIEVA